MFSQFPLLISIVAPVFLVIAIGYAMRKIGVLSAEADRSVTKLIVTLLAPALALHSIIGNSALTEAKNVLLPPLLGFGSVVLGIAVSRLCARLFKINDEARRAFIYTTSIHNYGYIPLPLVIALFKDREIMGFLFAFMLGVEVAFWSICLWQLTGKANKGSWKRAFNPPVVAILSAIALNFLHADIWLPTFVKTTYDALGACAVQIALLISGALIADNLNLESFKNRGHTILASAAGRIVIVPILGLVFAKYVPLDLALKKVLVVQAAMPAGIFPLVVTKVHHGDVPTALQVILGTSLIGLITIPFWISVGLYWIGH